MTYSTRTAKISDAIDCVEIIRDWIEETSWMPMLWEQASMEAYWLEVFETDMAWVVESGGRIVGFCTRNDDNIGALYVIPAMRRSGIGKSLLDLAKADRSYITVWAFEANEQARRFYRREGLIEVSRELDEEVNLIDVQHRWER